MSASADYCELCDLPRSTCIHGNPPTPPKPAPRPEPKPRAGAVRRSTTAARAQTPSQTRRVQHRWTPPEALRPHILAVLEDAGGELDADDVFTRLEERLEESFLAGDRERTPEGELRWRYAARRARQALLQEGVMVKGRPGVWQLA